MVLQNNTVLITGGSSGIGLEMAKQLLKKNNKVLICGSSQVKLEAAKKSFPEIEIFQCDLSKQEAYSRLAKWVEEKHPECNMLVNNAAIVHISDFCTDDSILEKANKEIQTNLIAPIVLSKFLLPVLEQNKNPKIINVTTGLVYAPKAAYPFYNATKAALHSFTQVLRMQMEKSPVSICEILLPVVDTPFHKGNAPKIAISVEKAVEEMIGGIEKGKLEIRVARVKLLYLISRVAPKFALRKINSLSNKV
jgi:uncharacterized oxidoreductase